jgi:hypothetical protein
MFNFTTVLSSKQYIKNITAPVLLVLFAFMHTARALHIHADSTCIQKGEVITASAKTSCDICDYQAAKEPCLVASEIEYAYPLFAGKEYSVQPQSVFSKISLSYTSRGPPCFI